MVQEKHHIGINEMKALLVIAIRLIKGPSGQYPKILANMITLQEKD